ncbi:MAG: DEAD/DEAH box helicase [Clostridiaceae bacterium]|jgi:ATP-dependent RNA helicase DeaD|nr:DEAD/DEAH box helicase [Clostridiaceae bacterium]
MEVINFKDLKLSDEVERALDDMGFEEATPIQIQSIPYILENRDVLGQAQTGTGKTCAFGIPAIEKINLDQDDIQVLVLCPTRELAIQSAKELKNVAKYKKEVRILPIYGGQPIERQIVSLKKHPQIIIGTPGRVMDHIRRHTIKFTNLKMIILDEADEMLNMGFREDIDTILTKAPEQIQTILFSATMSRDILEITGKYQKDPVKIKITHKVLTVPSVEQYSLEVNPNNKLEVLSRLIDVNNIKLGLVFCNTKRQVDELASSLQARGYSAEALHGDMRQESRDKVMAQFRKGNIEILIATDVAARGIDVNNVEAVFNYDLPNDEEYYVHRIGRTGRAGKTGKAFTFVSGREIIKLKDIQRFTKSSITPIKPPSVIDFKERRMRAIMDLTKQTILAGKHVGYTRYIEKMIEDFNIESEDNSFASTIDIAAALLKEYLEKINSTSLNMNNISEKPNITKGGFRGKRTDVKKRSRNYYKKH